MKAAILVDSTAYIQDKVKNRENIFPVYLSVNFPDGTVIIDKSEPLERRTFYDKMLSSDELPTTSQPSPGATQEAFEKIAADGYDTVFAVSISNELSGTFSTMRAIGQDFEDSLDIRYIDSKIVTLPEEIIVQYIVRMVEEGYDANVIEQAATDVIDNVKAYFSVNDLTNLIKGGRLNATVGAIGSVLKVRPTLAFDDKGSIGLKEIMRSEKKVLRKFTSYLQDFIDTNNNSDITVAVVGGDNQEGIDKMLDSISDIAKKYQLDVQTGEIGPVIATHTGKGALGIIMVPKPVIDGKVISTL